EAVMELGARLSSTPSWHWPCAIIGTGERTSGPLPAWQLSWEGWRGGVIPSRENARLQEDDAILIAPALAAAACAAEAFAFHAGDHPIAGRRAIGMSLWKPGAEWRCPDATEPRTAFLPSQLWIIGLGNLGQAYAWLLGCLPFPTTAQTLLVLQDFDHISP